MGDLSSGFVSSSRLTEGVKGHQEIQGKHPKEQAEIPISMLWETDRLIIEITGRIDRKYWEESLCWVEEIKTTSFPLSSLNADLFPEYWMQAKLYAAMVVNSDPIDTIGVKLTYLHIGSREIQSFVEVFTRDILLTFAKQIIEDFIDFQMDQLDWKELRNQSIQTLTFPFSDWRTGQKELSDIVYQAIQEENQLFTQAPTGIGKTIAVLFPSIRALGGKHADKIFYLTAKTITRLIAEYSLDLLRKKGLHIRSVTLTAKEKLCFQDTMLCDPDICPFANHYFQKLPNALTELLQNEKMDRTIIEVVARRHMVCPFELSLDASLQADCIICDYNYAFDPKVYLKRYFQDISGDFIFLIDEAHNLVERAREMFSASIQKQAILELKRNTKDAAPKVSKTLQAINSSLVELRKECVESERGYIALEEKPKTLEPLLRNFIDEADLWLSRNEKTPFLDKLIELYFQVFGFLRAMDWYDDKFATMITQSKNDLEVKLFCLDPSRLLSDALERGKSSIFFSATLTPLHYFRDILGGNSDAMLHTCHSPFPRENLFLLLDDKISTKYRNRENSYDRIVAVIEGLANSKPGNYLVFFPSYEYLREAEYRFSYTCPEVRTMIQKNAMNEAERESFLSQFKEEVSESLVAFAVMGGLFGEGIDLVGERLSGAVIVGVGLPQICLEREMIRQYFQQTRGTGFEFAYVYPGMNKVLQAAGRVIRTHTDRGAVILLDERFSTGQYRKLCPEDWHPIPRISDPKSLAEILKKFWES